MDLLKSKKFQAAIIGVLVVVAKHFFPEIDEESVRQILAILAVYILGQSLADALPGKEKVKAEARLKEEKQ